MTPCLENTAKPCAKLPLADCLVFKRAKDGAAGVPNATPKYTNPSDPVKKD